MKSFKTVLLIITVFALTYFTNNQLNASSINKDSLSSSGDDWTWIGDMDGPLEGICKYKGFTCAPDVVVIAEK